MNSTSRPSNATFGCLTIILGFVAFAGVVGHFFAGPVDPPPPIEVSIAEKAVSIRDATVAALKGEDYEARSTVAPRTLDDYMTYTFVALAVSAMLMAVIGFARQERWRMSAAGASLGAMALTFQFAVIVFFGLLFAIVLAAVIDKLDFDI